MSPALSGILGTDSAMSAILSNSIGFGSSSLRSPDETACYFFNMLFRGANMRTNLDTKRRNISHSPEMDCIYETLTGAFNLRIPSAA